MPSRIDILRDEFTRCRSGIDAIEQRATDENRDLTAEEIEQEAALFARCEELRTELEPLVARQRSLDATAEILQGLGLGQRPQPSTSHQRDVTPAEYLASYVRAHWEGDLDAHVARFRDVATQTTADHTGLLPTPILGPVINQIDATRYVVPTFTQKPMPVSGKQFDRPRITQHVDVDVQSAELAELASQKMTTTATSVSKRTVGGSLQISRQDQDWTDPAILQLVIDDFAAVYAKTTDAIAAASLTAAAAATSPWSSASVQAAVSSIGVAALTVYTASCAMPNALWVSLDQGIELGQMVGTDGHLAFPEIGVGRINVTDTGLGLGGPLGLRLFICPTLGSGTRILGSTSAAEWYEDRRGFLEVTFPSALKTELAYYGYIATYFHPNSFVKLD